jgi:small subunit ribosomal protein S3
MGQKVNPVGLRIGYVEDWHASWFSEKTKFASTLLEDLKIRKYIEARLNKASISKLYIERTSKTITLFVHSAKPGFIIGKGGVDVDKVRQELKKLFNKDIVIEVVEIRKPELDAKLIAQGIGSQLKARISHKKAMKQSISAAMKSGADGIKITISGRLGGVEIARSEGYKEGRVPLHTLRAKIDYCLHEANTIYGVLGIKVWLFKGEVVNKREHFSSSAVVKNDLSKPKFDHKKPGSNFKKRPVVKKTLTP